jgi:hypothetical protein
LQLHNLFASQKCVQLQTIYVDIQTEQGHVTLQTVPLSAVQKFVTAMDCVDFQQAKAHVTLTTDPLFAVLLPATLPPRKNVSHLELHVPMMALATSNFFTVTQLQALA